MHKHYREIKPQLENGHAPLPPAYERVQLTNAFSKKWENHWAATILWYCWYNFGRVHKSLRMTPAMAAGVADHIWSVRELLEAA